MTVKPPSGMQEELARPVIEVVEFPSGKITHEMFAFGSEIAVVPVDGQSGSKSPIQVLAKDALTRTILEWIGVESQVQFTSNSNANVYVPPNMVSTLVGKGGSNIRQLQEELGGISISVKTFDEMPDSLERQIHTGKMCKIGAVGQVGLGKILVEASAEKPEKGADKPIIIAYIGY